MGLSGTNKKVGLGFGATFDEWRRKGWEGGALGFLSSLSSSPEIGEGEGA
ncbi:hypothetical protein TIFTF001_016479 [Ficus carica]|uniref:Uncharacterized protein n=1 Tax=Ficus carica TaxID=3494 RepID=A0AA88A7T1_FICCA|nr:hypothetical protein TIFTF001_016479 [Ficus carica]